MAMKKKDLKKMSKRELLEIMLLQSKRIDELENEIDKMNSMLDDKKILLSNCGSIAEAALKLNNIFEAAQNAADQYLKNIELLSKEEIALRKSREEAEALKNKIDLVKETALMAIPVVAKKENIFKRMFRKIRNTFKFKKNRRRKFRKIVIKEKRVSKSSKVAKFKDVLKRLKDGIKNIFAKFKINIKNSIDNWKIKLREKKIISSQNKEKKKAEKEEKAKNKEKISSNKKESKEKAKKESVKKKTKASKKSDKAEKSVKKDKSQESDKSKKKDVKKENTKSRKDLEKVKKSEKTENKVESQKAKNNKVQKSDSLNKDKKVAKDKVKKVKVEKSVKSKAS